MRLRSTAIDPALHGISLPDGGAAAADRALHAELVAHGEVADAQGMATQFEHAGTATAGAAASFEAAESVPRQASLAHAGGASLLAPGDPRIDPRVVAAFVADGAAVAGMRDLRSALTSRWHADASDERRAVALVGVDPDVDVATVAANLAVGTAQLGWRTLLVDGDLQAPVQDALFRLSNQAGLSTLFEQPGVGRAPVQATAIDRLHLLPAGPAPANPGELIERQPLLAVLNGSIGRPRLVLLSLSARAQSGRFGAVDVILGGFDGAIVVAGRNRSGLRQLQRLTGLLEDGGVPVLATAVLP
jgi:Mrp family chromosome partitioning ATPase